jgi:biopolymer transport protein ExbD
MNKTQRIVLVLLVLAIMFSVTSIFISFTALNFDFPSRSTSVPEVRDSGSPEVMTIGLVVERNPDNSDFGEAGGEG